MRLQFFQVFIICSLYLMTQIYPIPQVFLIIQFVIHCILYTTVQVNRQYPLRTSTYTTGTQCITESVVLFLIAQAATSTQGIGVITEMCKEWRRLRVQFCCKSAPFVVCGVACCCKKSHR